MPTRALPRPVLSVTHDAVRNLQGREAVSSLWILFTKCKESLHDGRRLENIAWRLWYRALAQDEDHPSSLLGDEDEKDVFVEEKFDEKYDDEYSRDDLVEKRARDRDYGRTGSWEEREKDRLGVALDTLVGVNNMNNANGVMRGVTGVDEVMVSNNPTSNSNSDRATSGTAPMTPTQARAEAQPVKASLITSQANGSASATSSTTPAPVLNGVVKTVVDTTTTITPAPTPAPVPKIQRQGRCPSISTSSPTERRSSSAISRPSKVEIESEGKRRCSSACLSFRPALRRFSSSGAGGNGGGGVSVGMVICEMLPSSSLVTRHSTPAPALAPELAKVDKSASLVEVKSSSVEARSPPQERPTHVDLPILLNGRASSATGTLSGLPTPGEDVDLIRNGLQLGHVKDSNSFRAMESSGSGIDNGSEFGGGVVAVNGGIGAVPALDVSSVMESVSAGVPDIDAHLAPAGADQQQQVIYTTHNIQLVHPTPVHVTSPPPLSPPKLSTSADPLSPPKLVVVNPTPNPTPHPTPPATPVMLTTIPSNNVSVQFKGLKGAQVQYLALPTPFVSREREREGEREREDVLGPPLLRVPGPDGRRVVAMRVGIEPLEEIPEGKEEVVVPLPQIPPIPQQQQGEKSNSLSSASSGYSAISATTTATSVIELVSHNTNNCHSDNNKDKHNDNTDNGKKPELEQVDALSSALQVDVRTPVPELPSVPSPSPSPFLSTPAPGSAQQAESQFQAQMAESPVSQASMSPTKSGVRATSPTHSAISGCSPTPSNSNSNSNSKATRPTAGLIRRASSGASSTSRSRSTGTTSSRGISRSRSRDGSGAGATTSTAVVAGLTMTTTRPAVAVAAAGKVIRTKSKGVLGKGARKGSAVAIALARRGSEGEKVEREEREREKARDTKPKFNIGSNSDDGSGMGSKSAGSGSDGSHPAIARALKGKGKEDTLEKERLAALAVQLQIERERESQMRGQVEQEKLQQERMREQHLQQALAQAQAQQRKDKDKDLQRQQQEVQAQRQAALAKGAVNPKEMQRQLEAMIAFGQKAGVAGKNDSNSRLDLQPLLPQNKKKIVLATSESEFSEGEDWSDSELSGEEIEVRRGNKSGYQPAPPAPLPPAPLPPHEHHHQQAPQRPPGPRRTQSSTVNHTRKLTVQQRNHQLLLEQAARDNREREMFAKRPSASYTNLQATQRSRSGLLTQLLNPDPRIFPPGYPNPYGQHYAQRGFSSGEISGGFGVGGFVSKEEEERREAVRLEQRRRAQFEFDQVELEKRLRMEVGGLGGGMGLKQLPERPPPAARREERKEEKKEERKDVKDGKQKQPARAVPLPAMAPKLGKSKSAAALPVMSGVQVGSVAPSRAVSPRADFTSPHLNGTNANASGSGSGYRPRPRPQGTEMEDSESEDEAEGGVGFSKSVAEEKLKVLAEKLRKSSVTSGGATRESQRGSKDMGDEIPVWARERPPPAQQQVVDQRREYFDPHQFPSHQGPNHHHNPHPPVPPSPIPLGVGIGHPYNLPPPEPPMTPRTTRRKMLQSELSESLRRNILWERKVSRVDLKRTSSAGGRGNLLNGIRPLTTTPSMVQLTAKGAKPPPGAVGGGENGDRTRRKSAGIEQSDEEEREQARRAAITRNRSWAADDFHIRGW